MKGQKLKLEKGRYHVQIAQLRALIASHPWLADEEWFHAFVTMVVSGAFNEAGVLEKKDAHAFSSTGLTTGLNTGYNGTSSAGIGIVSVSGPLFNRPNFLTEYLGIGTTYSAITKQVKSFAGNDEINSIVLDVDSPGGEVSGVNESSSIITKIAEQKPVYSYVSGLGASAAYWLMSGSKEIAIDATARVGSIGVVASFWNPEDDDVIEIVNSASPNKRPDITKDEGKKVIVEELDALADVFIGTVAKNRDVSEKTVKSDFGKGGVLVGTQAMKAGMVDKVMFLQEFIESIKLENKKEPVKSSSNLNNLTKEDVSMDIATLKEKHPEVYKAMVEEAAAQTAAATAEKDKELDAVIKERDALKASLDKQKDNNRTLTERVQSLEKNDIIRAEKDMKAAADVMISQALTASKIPGRLHAKVAKQLDHNKFVTDGKLDADAFKEAIAAEVKDWEELTADSNVIQGMTFAEDKTFDSDNKAEDDALVKRMTGYLN